MTEINSDIFICFEFVQEGSLEDFLQKITPQGWASKLPELAKGAISGMEFLHSKGLIHRDLAGEYLFIFKLSARNLLVGRQGGKYEIVQFF